MKGIKHDADKPQWSLLPFAATEQVVEVLTYGAKKYAPDNWKHVDDWRNRYASAAMRHFSAWMQGEEDDCETGLNHLAHAICCLMFLIERENEPCDTE